MKVLLSWLKEYVDIDVTPGELEKKLFSTGFEVESVSYLGENIEKIYVGQVVSIEKYEGTHLYICHVDCGEQGHDHLILTGADNVFAGAKVPACLVGAKLPNGLEIAPRKMKDMVSYGMLCSGSELGLDKDWYPGADVDGIMILQEDAPVGEDIKTYLGLDDYVYDISITANRPDCQSVLGIAREVAAFLGKEIKEPAMDYVCDGRENTDISVTVVDRDLCPRYLGHYVYDVQDKESPLWMKRRLLAVGHNVINAMVDITNYVLVEIGQPMHAFDLRTLEGSSIVVRRAQKGEELVTLDGKNRVLDTNNLLICDKAKAVGLAGVMGGLNSEITEDTREVLFESAKFRKDSVRKTARGLGLHSDAAARYEKGVDEYSVECGMARALHLVGTLGVAKVGASHFDVSAGASVEKKIIQVEIDKVNAVLGIQVPEEEMVKILQNLAFGVESQDGILTLSVPRYREDIESDQDIAEEVIREYGYDKLHPTFLKDAVVTKGGLSREQQKELAVKTFLCTQGYSEIQTIAMTSRAEFDQFLLTGDADERQAVEILNPITENLCIMRTFLAPSMVRAIENNIKNGHLAVRFFELANVYRPKSVPLTEAPREIKTLCLGSMGEQEDFFTMKETLENLATDSGLTFVYKKDEAPYLHPGRTAGVYCNGEKIGIFGQLKYDVADSLTIAKDKKTDIRIFIAQIDYDALKANFRTGMYYEAPSPYAGAVRDLSIIVDKSVACGEIITQIEKADELVTGVELFDLFESEKLGSNNKSMAFTITLASPKQDVTDGMAEETMGKIVKLLGEVYGAQMRS